MARSNRSHIERRPGCAYLYSDGSLVQLFEEYRDGVQIGQTADVTLGYCQVYLSSKLDSDWHKVSGVGRIVLHRYGSDGFLPLAKGGRIEATSPSVHNGSQNTKERNIEVQYVKLTTKQGLLLSWSDATSVLSSQFTVQVGASFLSDVSKLYVGSPLWSDYDTHVMKITDLRPKTEPVSEVA